MNQELFNRIEELFLEKLSTKTGWGRIQIKQIWQSAKMEATKNTLSIDGRIKMLEKVIQDNEQNKYSGMSLVEAMDPMEQLHQLYDLKIGQFIVKVENKFKDDTK